MALFLVPRNLDTDVWYKAKYLRKRNKHLPGVTTKGYFRAPHSKNANTVKIKSDNGGEPIASGMIHEATCPELAYFASELT